MDPQNFGPKFASLFSEESLALPPEFDSFCVRHSPANEQVINEEFPGETSALLVFFHQDLLVKPGENWDVFQGRFFGWTWDLLTLEVWSLKLILRIRTKIFRMPCFFFGFAGLDAHLESQSRNFPESPIGTLTGIGMTLKAASLTGNHGPWLLSGPSKCMPR